MSALSPVRTVSCWEIASDILIIAVLIYGVPLVVGLVVVLARLLAR
jgi:hypothetical protein